MVYWSVHSPANVLWECSMCHEAGISVWRLCDYHLWIESGSMGWGYLGMVETCCSLLQRCKRSVC